MGNADGSAADLLISAFMSMQAPTVVVSFARDVGGGCVSQFAQQFFLEKCFNNEVHLKFPSSQAYVRRVVKAIILAAESDEEEVKQDLYDLHSIFLDSDNGAALTERCYKTFSFMIPEEARSNLAQSLGEHVASEFMGTKLLTVRVSVNILEGDTGFSVWPAGLFLAEVLLSHPELVSGKSCMELGSGTGISGIWLSMLSPSKAVLTDGSVAGLVNLKHNLKINGIPISSDAKSNGSERSSRTKNSKIHCKQLLWGAASEEELQAYNSEVIVGADIIYDPAIVPSLVRVLAVLLRGKSNIADESEYLSDSNGGRSLEPAEKPILCPVAYLVSALRNVATNDLFRNRAAEAGLEVVDVTESLAPLRILAESNIFDRSQLRLYKVTFSQS